MRFYVKLLNRLLFLLLVAVLLAWGGVLAWFTSWRNEKMASLNAASAVAQTPGGAVEYVQSGEGPAVLVFHGAPGGYDQAALLGSELREDGFQVIAPSRPGYLRTSLATGLTPDREADTAAGFLDDVVHVGSVAVVGFSYGAPAAVEFARRHPERTRALVLISPVLKPGDKPEQRLPEVVNERLTGDMGSWLAVKTAMEEPAKALGWAFDLTQQGGESAREAWTSAVLKSPEQLAWFRQLVGTLAPINPRETGLRNDLLQMRAIPEIPYEKIGTPTLIVHGAGDRFVSAADVLNVSKRMPRAEVFNVEDTGHLVQLGPNAGAVRERIASFLKPFNGAAN